MIDLVETHFQQYGWTLAKLLTVLTEQEKKEKRERKESSLSFLSSDSCPLSLDMETCVSWTFGQELSVSIFGAGGPQVFRLSLKCTVSFLVLQFTEDMP